MGIGEISHYSSLTHRTHSRKTNLVDAKKDLTLFRDTEIPKHNFHNFHCFNRILTQFIRHSQVNLIPMHSQPTRKEQTNHKQSSINISYTLTSHTRASNQKMVGQQIQRDERRIKTLFLNLNPNYNATIHIIQQGIPPEMGFSLWG